MLITADDFLQLRENPVISPDEGMGFSREEVEEMRRRWAAFWHEEGLDYDDLNRWCAMEAEEDCQNYGLPVMPVAPAVAAGYDMGFVFGWMLHKKAMQRRKR